MIVGLYSLMMSSQATVEELQPQELTGRQRSLQNLDPKTRRKKWDPVPEGRQKAVLAERIATLKAT